MIKPCWKRATAIDSKTAAFHPNEKSNQFCSTRPVFLSWLWTWIRLISVRTPAWSYAIYQNLRQPHAHGTPLTPDINNLPPVWTVRTIIPRMAHHKFHGISNIQTWMWSTLHSYGFYDNFYLVLHANQPCHPLPHGTPLIGSTFFFKSSSYAFGFFRAASSPFTNLLVLCPKTAPCPEAAAQATTAAAADQAADQAADHCKAFPELLRAGFWLAAILTRSERGANEVQTRRNQILGDWPPRSPDKVFGSHTPSHSFQNSKTQELSAVKQKRKPSQAAAAGKSKETEEETKGE